MDDAKSIAKVFTPSHRLLDFLPQTHTAKEDRWFITNVILRDCTVMVAERHNLIVSFIAWQQQEIRLLHTHPDFLERGAGGMLLDAAKDSGAEVLELWCFQSNIRARQFYEARGFQPIRFTDGARNEERTPDVRYRWERRSND